MDVEKRNEVLQEVCAVQGAWKLCAGHRKACVYLRSRREILVLLSHVRKSLKQKKKPWWSGGLDVGIEQWYPVAYLYWSYPNKRYLHDDVSYIKGHSGRLLERGDNASMTSQHLLSSSVPCYLSYVAWYSGLYGLIPLIYTCTLLCISLGLIMILNNERARLWLNYLCLCNTIIPFRQMQQHTFQSVNSNIRNTTM